MTSSAPYTESYILGPQNTQFYTRTYYPPSSEPPRALLVFVHGFNEHIGRYTHVHTPFPQRGIAVFACDQRGFGLTAQKKENGAGKKYAQTSWKEQLEDIEWAVKEGRRVEGCGDIPVFLMGHSMGGGLALALPTRTGPAWPHPSAETVSLLSGVIVTSPFIILTHPASSIKRWFGGKMASISPKMIIPAVVKGGELSHDPKVTELYNSDPLIRQVGSLRGLSDMLGGGEQLLHSDYQHWPKTLPLLLIHGTEDQVTSCKATQTFYDKVVADDKKLSLYEGGYHELQNEPDGVQEKLVDECIVWMEAHILGANSASAADGANAEAATPTSKL